MWTHFQIEIVLHHDGRPGQPFYAEDKPLYIATVAELKNVGVLEEKGGVVRTTDLGKKIVLRWLDSSPMNLSVEYGLVGESVY